MGYGATRFVSGVAVVHFGVLFSRVAVVHFEAVGVIFMLWCVSGWLGFIHCG